MALFSPGAKGCGPKKKKKKIGAKITVSICFKDKRPKRGLGGCGQFEDIGVYNKWEK